jgi:hypothetical protein
MKVSLNWLKDYLDISHSPEEIADKLTALGLETVFENMGKSFSGVVLGKVVECEPHENADKLSVCEVDTGDGENYSIVCGAPNVIKGIYVPVAKVGATLQNGEFKYPLLHLELHRQLNNFHHLPYLPHIQIIYLRSHGVRIPPPCLKQLLKNFFPYFQKLSRDQVQ